MLTPDIIDRLEQAKPDSCRSVQKDLDLAIEEITSLTQLLDAHREFILSGTYTERGLLTSMDAETRDLYRRYFGAASTELDDALDQMFGDGEDREEEDEDENIESYGL